MSDKSRKTTRGGGGAARGSASAGGRAPEESMGNQAILDLIRSLPNEQVPYRPEMEDLFGEDFADVRAVVGTPEAQVALDLLGADAAVEGDLLLVREAAPDREVVAHELAHVAQGRQGTGSARQSRETDASEREAAGLARLVAAGQPVQVEARGTAQVHREASTDLGGSMLGESQLYAHGGYMGAIGDLMADPQWASTLAELSPDVYAEVSRSIDKDPEDAMLAAENDPVLAAYGVLANREAQAQAGQVAVVALEWDLWIDERDPGNLLSARVFHGDPIWDLAAGNEKDMPDHIREDSGSSAFGWLLDFGTAIAQAESGDWGLEVSATQAFDTAVRTLEGCGGLVLDVKSEYSAPEHVGAFVEELEGYGIPVKGVLAVADATGDWKDILAGVDESKRLACFHGVNDLEERLPELQAAGTTKVLINLGSLLDGSDSDGWALDQDALTRLELMVSGLGLQVGGYVQETDISPAAHEVLVDLVVGNRSLFALGYAYGGVDGQAAQGVSGSGHGSQVYVDSRSRELTEEDDAHRLSDLEGRATRYGAAARLMRHLGFNPWYYVNTVGGEAAGLAAFCKEASLLDILEEPESGELADYRLEDPLNRAELAKMVCSALELEPVEDDQRQDFSDVEAGIWYAKWVHALVDAGLVSGYKDEAGELTGRYGPADPIQLDHLDVLLDNA